MLLNAWSLSFAACDSWRKRGRTSASFSEDRHLLWHRSFHFPIYARTFASGFCTKILYTSFFCPTRKTCPPPPRHLVLLDIIAWKYERLDVIDRINITETSCFSCFGDKRVSISEIDNSYFRTSARDQVRILCTRVICKSHHKDSGRSLKVARSMTQARVCCFSLLASYSKDLATVRDWTCRGFSLLELFPKCATNTK